jgi:hypothetical protein
MLALVRPTSSASATLRPLTPDTIAPIPTAKETMDAIVTPRHIGRRLRRITQSSSYPALKRRVMFNLLKKRKPPRHELNHERHDSEDERRGCRLVPRFVWLAWRCANPIVELAARIRRMRVPLHGESPPHPSLEVHRFRVDLASPERKAGISSFPLPFVPRSYGQSPSC